MKFLRVTVYDLQLQSVLAKDDMVLSSVDEERFRDWLRGLQDKEVIGSFVIEQQTLYSGVYHLVSTLGLALGSDSLTPVPSLLIQEEHALAS